MDLVAQQGLSQGPFLSEINVHNPKNGKDEEEVSIRRGASSPSTQDRTDLSDCTAALAVLDARRHLLAAVRQDDAPKVLTFVAQGLDIGLLSEAMHLAAQRGSAAVVRELVAVGLSVNDLCPSTGFTPLQLGAVAGHLVVCELLLDAQADVHRPVGGSTALMLARKMGNAEIEEVIERHVASMVLTDQGDSDEAAHYRRAHVLPRVSPVLSEAVLLIDSSPDTLRPSHAAAGVEDSHPRNAWGWTAAAHKEEVPNAVVCNQVLLRGAGGSPLDRCPPPPSPSSVDPRQAMPL